MVNTRFNKNLNFGAEDHFMNKKWVANTEFKTNLSIQAICLAFFFSMFRIFWKFSAMIFQYPQMVCTFAWNATIFLRKRKEKIICTYWTKMLYSLCFLAVELYTKKMAINFLLFWQQDNISCTKKLQDLTLCNNLIPDLA